MITTSRDVAQYLLDEYGPMDTWKLQKLVYFVQAWHLAEHDSPAFHDEIQAFVDGPVARDLFKAHQNQKIVSDVWRGNSERVDPTVRETVSKVWDQYGAESGETLRELTHSEPAWIEAREGLETHEPSDKPLSMQTMARTTREYLKALASIAEPGEGQDLAEYLRQVAASR